MLYLCVRAKTWSPGGRQWHHTEHLAQTTRRKSTCMVSLGNAFLWKDLWRQTEGNETLQDIYCQCQGLLSPRGKWGQQEIRGENLVLSLVWEAKKNCRLSLSSKTLNSEVCVEASTTSEAKKNERFTGGTSDVPTSPPQHFAHGGLFNYFAMVHNFDCAADVASPSMSEHKTTMWTSRWFIFVLQKQGLCLMHAPLSGIKISCRIFIIIYYSHFIAETVL